MDTSAARQAIFSRIRQAQKRPSEPSQAELDKVQSYLGHHEGGPRPDIGSDLTERFRQQALRTSQTLDEVSTLADVPAAVARYLDGLNMPKTAIGWETLATLPWQQAGVDVARAQQLLRRRIRLAQCINLGHIQPCIRLVLTLLLTVACHADSCRDSGGIFAGRRANQFLLRQSGDLNLDVDTV